MPTNNLPLALADPVDPSVTPDRAPALLPIREELAGLLADTLVRD